MGKYSKQFKLSAIHAYHERGQGFRHIATQLQMDFTLLRRWVAAYELHGAASLQGRVKEHSPEFKLSVVQHMEREKLSFRQTAAVFNLGSSTQIGRWQKQYYSGGIEALTSGKKGPRNVMPKPPTKPRKPLVLTDEERAHKELLDELQFLRMENAYLKKLKELREEAIRRDKAAKKKPT